MQPSSQTNPPSNVIPLRRTAEPVPAGREDRGLSAEETAALFELADTIRAAGLTVHDAQWAEHLTLYATRMRLAVACG